MGTGLALALALVAVAACGDDATNTTGAGGGGAGGGGAASSGGEAGAAPGVGGVGEGGGDTGTGGASTGPVTLDLASALDAEGEGSVSVEVSVDGAREITITLGGAERVIAIDVAGAAVAIELDAEASTQAVDVGVAPAPFAAREGGQWLRPRPVGSRDVVLRLEGSGVVTITASAHGAPAPAVRRERSLAWTEAELLDDPSVVGAARVLGAIAEDGHGGRLLDGWFRRFATTIHSERAGPAQLMDQIAAEQGADPSLWDLDALPFRITGVHDRLDLAARGDGCGELRVSMASIDPVVAPLHALFLFRQEPRDDDVAPDGALHCLGTARRWARLSAMDGEPFLEAARAWLDEAITFETFLLAETVELTVSPWEWRQWERVGPDTLENPPLFQTVASSELNAPGALRDDFLGFVAERADALAARAEPIPERFRRPSARVPPSAPAERLSLEGLDAAVREQHPDLARAIEIVGCPTCHTETAEFVQTSVDREFSPFYDAELDARAARLDRLNAGVDEPPPPFGPLQE